MRDWLTLGHATQAVPYLIAFTALAIVHGRASRDDGRRVRGV